MSGGPTFGYEHCVQHVTDEQASELDLRTWKLAFVGAEAVRAEVLAKFARKFAPAGFAKSSFFPAMAWRRPR